MADALPEAPTPAPTKKPDPDRLNRVDSPGRPILQDFEGGTQSPKKLLQASHLLLTAGKMEINKCCNRLFDSGA